MARSKITGQEQDLISDSGAVLWSIVKGEQLEYPITVDFIEDTDNYEFEAVVVEGNNVAGQKKPPTTIKTGGIQETLVLRLPDLQGTWDAGTAYNFEEIVLYAGIYYRLTEGVARVSAITPDLDELWEVTALNIIYVQFPSTMASTWEDAPAVDVPIYGFFELRVTEPNNAVYQKTWKPVRGMVEILFSPTDIVP